MNTAWAKQETGAGDEWSMSPFDLQFVSKLLLKHNKSTNSVWPRNKDINKCYQKLAGLSASLFHFWHAWCFFVCVELSTTAPPSVIIKTHRMVYQWQSCPVTTHTDTALDFSWCSSDTSITHRHRAQVQPQRGNKGELRWRFRRDHLENTSMALNITLSFSRLTVINAWFRLMRNNWNKIGINHANAYLALWFVLLFL